MSSADERWDGGEWSRGEWAEARPPATFAARVGDRATAAPTRQGSRPRQQVARSPVAESLDTIAHELRTPLATLGVSLEILAEWRELRPEEIDELVGRLGRGVRWLDRLVENLSAWSAVETAGLTLRRAPAPVLDWITPALALVRPLLDGRGQAVEFVCVGEPAWVDGDAMRLSQALVNLLVNASKYSVRGDRLAVTVAADEAWVRVAVTDHGDGVPPEERGRIFERRARGLAAIHSGVRGQGIGLDVVGGVVEAHGGTVGVESAHGRGATFWFILPRYRAGARDISPRRARATEG